MKNYRLFKMGTILLAASLMSSQMAFAADFDTDTDGKVAITDKDSNAEFKFQASPQVTLGGDISNTAFIVAGVHGAVYGKDNGYMYAMTSDTSGLYSASTAAATELAKPGMPDTPTATLMEAALTAAGYALTEKKASEGK